MTKLFSVTCEEQIELFIESVQDLKASDKIQ